jgi:hypothetical protein
MRLRTVTISILSLLTGIVQLPLAAQSLQVNSASPNAAAQGTINLDVAIGGSGFKHGAKSQWFVSGTTNPGGVTVNSTTFVSSNQLTANITVADTATIASFDVLVQNTDGRTGKGTGLFSVQSKNNASTQGCILQPLPAGFTLMNTLNYVNSSGAAQYSGAFGLSVRLRKVTLGAKDVLVTAVGSGVAQRLDIFFIDPLTATVLDGTAIGTNTQAQPHIAKSIAIKPARMVIGDFNGDGVPDIAVGQSLSGNGLAYFFLGAIDSLTGVLSYSDAMPISPPKANINFGSGLAAADLDGDGKDELVVAAGAVNSGSTSNQVFLFKFNSLTSSFSAFQTLNDPAPKSKTGFGLSVALADVTSTSSLDLIVGANSATYVYPGPSFASSLVFPTGGSQVEAANVDGGSFQDLVAANSSGASVYSGLLSAGEPAAFTVTPIAGVPGIWLRELVLGDINGDGLADIVAGAPNNAGSSSCPGGGGSVYVYLTNPATPNQPVRYMLEPPRIGVGYGEAVEVAPAYRLIFVGENHGDVDSVTGPGQVWVYKVN